MEGKFWKSLEHAANAKEASKNLDDKLRFLSVTRRELDEQLKNAKNAVEMKARVDGLEADVTKQQIRCEKFEHGFTRLDALEASLKQYGGEVTVQHTALLEMKLSMQQVDQQIFDLWRVIQNPK